MGTPVLAVPAVAQVGQRVTDESVDAAIGKAISFIKSQRSSGRWETGDKPSGQKNWGGRTALAVLALLYAGEDPQQNDMAESLKWLVSQRLKGTYSIGIRAHALSLVPGTSFRSDLQRDVDWLLKAMNPAGTPGAGGYDYVMPSGRGGGYDHSNSQYGVLGIWTATDAGIHVPDEFWTVVEQRWLTDQLPDGGWAYKKKGNVTGSMTAAGLATLFVTLEKAHGHDEGAFNGYTSARCGEHKEAQVLLTAIERALSWFGQAFVPEQNPGGQERWKYYYLYGVERIGRASGRKNFGQHDWFREGAAVLLDRQQPNGSWSGGENELVDTCFSLMFLSHGRAPLLFNKLEHGDDWNNKLRDVAGLAHYAEKRFEKLMNWQIVDLKSPITDMLEAPILFMSGHNAWEFSDEEVEKLRAYCNRGGMILANSCCSSTAFSTAFKKLAVRLYPQFPLREVPADRDLIGSVLAGMKDPPRLLEVNNGVRTLIIHSERDLSGPWNQNRSRGKWAPYFELGCNLYLYATDKTSIRSRLQTPDIPFRETPITRTIKVARVKHSGMWDPEPYGWKRLATYLNNETATKLELTNGVTFDQLDPRKFKIAYVTGSGKLELSKAELKGLTRFIRRGGTLLGDAAGGSREFADSFENIIAAVPLEMKYLQKDSFLLNGEGIPDAVPLDHIGYRRTARSAGRGHSFPRIRAATSGKRLAVLFVPMDISAGLLGTNIYDCRGYDADSCLRIAQTLLMYANLSRSAKAKL